MCDWGVFQFFLTFSDSAVAGSNITLNPIIYTHSHASFPFLHLLKILPHPTSKAPLTFFTSIFYFSLLPLFFFLSFSFSLPHFAFLGFCACCWDLLHNGFIPRPLHWFQGPFQWPNLFPLSCRSLLWLQQAQIQNLAKKNDLGIRFCLCGQPFPAPEGLREGPERRKEDKFGTQQGLVARGVWWVRSGIVQCWPSIGSLLFQVQFLFSGWVGVPQHEFFQCCDRFDGEFGQWGEWISRQGNQMEENGVLGEEHIPYGSLLDQVLLWWNSLCY